MGFFDDLDDEVNPGLDAPMHKVTHDFTGVFERLAGGWRWSDSVSTPGKEKGEFTVEQVNVYAESDRFVHETSVMERRGRDDVEVKSQKRLSLDAAGLVEVFVDQPLLAQKIVAAAEAESGDGPSW